MLKGKNVFLTPIERHNLVSVHQWLKELDNFFYFSDQFITPPTLDEIEIWYNSLINNNKNKVFIINHNETKVSLGMVELSKIDWKNRNAYIGVLIGNRNQRGKGFATESLKILINLAFQYWNLHKLYALIVDNNLPSIKLFEKMNFTKEAVLIQSYFVDNEYHDQFLYSLLRNDYEKNLDKYAV
ncbi:MAG: GNAT family N-acetyltransferase [bacterium]